MKYCEKYFLFTRHFELLDSHLVARGEGWFNPSYEVRFEYRDLNPIPQKVRFGNRFRLIPSILSTVLLGILMIGLASIHDAIGDYTIIVVLALFVVSCFATMVNVFRRYWWNHYVNKFGVICFGLVDRKGDSGYGAFSHQLHEKIASHQ